LVLGMGAGASAQEAPVRDSEQEETTKAPVLQAAGGEVTPVLFTANRTPATQGLAFPLTGRNAWLVAGALGALVPLIFFALPVLMFAWFGPFAPLAFLVALVFGTLATALGGVVAWAVSYFFTDVRSGIVMPVAAAAVTGFISILVGGVIASLEILAGLGLIWLAGGPSPSSNLWNPATYSSGSFLNPTNSFIFAATGAVAFVVWATAVVVASIAGPVVAAQVYRAEGTFKSE